MSAKETIHITRVALGVVVVLCTSTIASAQIVVNGSFENGLTGWTATGDQAVVTNNSAYPPSSGASVYVSNINQAQLIGPNRSVLSQTVATTPGQRYGLTFDYGTVKGIIDQKLRVTVQGSAVLFDQAITIAAPANIPFYVPQHISFVADTATTTLTFADQSPSGAVVDSLLDNVQLVPEAAGSPLIATQPQRSVAPVGGQATFSVTPFGTGPFTYQWKYNGGIIGGETGSSYTARSITNAYAGNFSVVVTNAAGSVESSAATLTVVPAGILLNGSFEYGSAAWTFTDTVATTLNTAYQPTEGVELVHFSYGQLANGGVVSQTFSTTPGTQYALDFDVGAISYVNQDQQSVLVKVQGANTLLSQSLSVAAPGNGTTYLHPSFTFVADSTTTTLSFTDTSSSTLNVDLVLDNVRVNSASGLPVITSHPQSTTAQLGGTVTFTVVASSADPLSYQWRRNGQITLFNANSSSFTISNVQSSDAGVYDVIVTNSAGSVTSNPATLTVNTGGGGGGGGAAFTNGSFESDFTGWTPTGNLQVITNGSFGYTSTDGAKLVGFNAGNRTPNGVVTQAFATTSGQSYTLAFDVGAFSFVTQDTQRLEVTVQGGSTLVSQIITVTAPGNGTTWVARSFPFVANSATTTLTFRDVSLVTDNVDLTLDNVRVTTSSGPTPPAITTQPQSQTVTAGSPVTFTVTATGTAPLAYQWRFNGSAISGATSNSYSIASAQAANAGSYTVVVSNGGGSVTSNAATLTVNSGSGGGGGTFTNGSFESDFTGWTPTGNLQIITNGSFGYTATDGAKLVAFNAGQRTPNGVVTQAFATTSGQSYTLAFDVGAFSFVTQDTQRLEVTVQGSTTLLSQIITVTAPANGTTWVARNFPFVANSATTTLTFRDVSLVTDNVDLTLDNVRVTTSAPSTAPSITAQPQSQTVTVGSPVTFSVTATGTAPLSYQWRLNGSPINGATATNYVIPNAQPADAGSYTVVVSNGGGSVTSAAATLTVNLASFANGSFESNYASWSASGNQQVVTAGSNGYTATNGTKAVVFNAGQRQPNGVLTQTFAATAGRTYRLTFDVGAFSMLNEREQTMRVRVLGSATLLDQTITLFAPGNGTQWSPRTFTFVADGAAVTLSFEDLSTTSANVDLTLDNVAVSLLP